MLSILLLLGSTLGVAWAPNYAVFCILRFLVGMSCAGMFMTGFVLGELFQIPKSEKKLVFFCDCRP